jgi:hypothetical protein
MCPVLETSRTWICFALSGNAAVDRAGHLLTKEKAEPCPSNHDGQVIGFTSCLLLSLQQVEGSVHLSLEKRRAMPLSGSWPYKTLLEGKDKSQDIALGFPEKAKSPQFPRGWAHFGDGGPHLLFRSICFK